MVCISPMKLDETLIVPCGRCMPCRINRVRAWTIRILMEFHSFDQKGLFVTLTYDNEHIPEHGTLRKLDLQKFIKRLRKDLYPRKIKYFACGEYGSTTNRPHYHLIILGVTDNDANIIRKNWTYCNWRYLQKSSIGSVTVDSIQYVCGYVQKKIFGQLGKREYLETGRIPPFQLQSHGLGLNYCTEHLSEYINTKGIPYKSGIAPFPRYFKEKLANEFPSDFFENMSEEIKQKDYQEYLEKFRKFWKQGKRGKYLRESVYETEQTEKNYKVRFELTKRGKL